jgi:vacuolar-type H+-ATPase subunit I/STV1
MNYTLPTIVNATGIDSILYSNRLNILLLAVNVLILLYFILKVRGIGNRINDLFKANGDNAIIQLDSYHKQLENNLNDYANKQLEPLNNVISNGNNTIRQLKDIDNRVMDTVNARLNDYSKQLDGKAKDFDDKVKQANDDIGRSIDAEIVYSGIKDFTSKINEHNRNLQVIMDYVDIIPEYQNEMKQMILASIKLMLDKMELSKRARKELADEIIQLGIKLTQTSGQDYKDKLARLTELKDKLKRW